MKGSSSDTSGDITTTSGNGQAWTNGDKVVVSGLKRAMQYNGKIGTITSKPKDSGDRYAVAVDGKKIAVLPCNLKSVSNEEIFHRLIDLGSLQIERLESMERSRYMIESVMSEEQRIKLFGGKIKPMPNFRDELRLEGGGFPTGVYSTWGDRYLRFTFEHGCSLPHADEGTFKQAQYQASSEEVFRRLGLGSYHPFKHNWYLRQPRRLGDIFPSMVHSYSSMIRHSYSNQPYQKAVLHGNSTHVAVGYVDLGILLEADLQKSNLAGSGPLHFLGVDMSPYATAKTLVIWEMLHQCQQDAGLRHVMQVWFSTTWEEETAVLANKALVSLCDAPEQKTRHPKVAALLKHWRDAGKMPLVDARVQWANLTDEMCSCISHVERKQDRIALAKYELTGDFGFTSGESPAYGNTLMFDCPKGTGPLMAHERVFTVIDWKVLVAILSPSTTVIDAAEQYLMERLSKVSNWAQKGEITLELVLGKVEEMVDQVASSRPKTMSWSNVIDYMDYGEFHKLARACSVNGGTLHFGYSMNWTYDVFGVNLLDFSGAKNVKRRVEAIDNAHKHVESLYKSCGWEKYLRLPRPTNPVDMANFSLEAKQCDKWARHVFEVGQREGHCEWEINHFMAPPLSPTGVNTLFFNWTYDSEVKVHG